MPMRFTITANDFFVDNPEMQNDYVFKKLTSQEAKFIAYFCDFASPYARMDTEERAINSAKAAGFVKKTGGLTPQGEELVAFSKSDDGELRGNLKTAVYRYGEFQGNTVLRSSIDAIDFQMKRIQAKLRQNAALEDSTHIKNWLDALNKCLDHREKFLNKMEAYNEERKREEKLRRYEEEAQKEEVVQQEDLSVIEEMYEEEA